MYKMLNPVVCRFYIKGVLTANSPFVISTNDDYFDLVPLRDVDDKPFIPGSSIAGVLRDLLHDEEKKNFFGYAEEDDSTQSLIITYDCFLRKDSPLSYSVRDGIKLEDDRKTAQKGAKFNYEIVEPGCSFDFKMEVVIRKNNNKDHCIGFIKAMIKQLHDGAYLGAKTSRGLGRFILDSVKVFTISGDNAYQDYVNFNWEHSSFVAYEESDFSSNATVNLKDSWDSRSYLVTCKDTLLIRNYDDPLGADSRMVTSGNSPVIPGSSWNGLFRHHARLIIEELGCERKNAKGLIKEIFGSDAGDKADKKQASNIVFSDSVIENAKSFMQTNVKVDRFTQGAAAGALFNCRPIASFETNLYIQLRKPEQWIWDLLHLVMCDINDGYAALGGQTSVGRGILQIEIEQTQDYTALSEKIREYLGKEVRHA